MPITAFPINTVLPTASVVTNTTYGFLTATNVQASLQQVIDNTVATSRQVIAGNGLTGGGNLVADRTLNVGAGTGISILTDTVGLDIASTRNTDHAAVTLTAGAGLTGGGDISASRTFAVGAGAGIAIAADTVGVDTAANFTWSGTHNFTGAVTGAGSLEGTFSVKDYGAIGDGVADDTAAIQAAVDAALQAIDGASGNGFYGKVFFPPGHYKTTASIIVPQSAHDRSIIFEGVGSASQISGSFNGYIFKNLFEQPNAGITGFRNLSIGNGATTLGSGAISWGNVLQGAFYENLSLGGFCGIDMTGPYDGSNFCPKVDGCNIAGNNVSHLPNSVGVRMSTGGGGSLTNCIIRGFNHGLRINSGLVYGVDFENNMIGLAAGVSPSISAVVSDGLGYGAATRPGQTACMNSTFEANAVGIYVGGGRLTCIGVTAGADSFCSPMSSLLGGIVVTGNTTNGSPIITGISPNTTGMYPHQQLKLGDENGPSYQTNTIDSATQLTLSTNWTSNPGAGVVNNTLFLHRLSTHILRAVGANNASAFINCSFGGPCSAAAVQYNSAGMDTFINTWADGSSGGSGVSWILPAAIGYTFIGYPFGGIGVPPPSSALSTTLAIVTANVTAPWEGMELNINDCTTGTATFRTVPVGGGSNHVRIRWDGSAWRVVG